MTERSQTTIEVEITADEAVDLLSDMVFLYGGGSPGSSGSTYGYYAGGPPKLLHRVRMLGFVVLESRWFKIVDRPTDWSVPSFHGLLEIHWL